MDFQCHLVRYLGHVIEQLRGLARSQFCISFDPFAFRDHIKDSKDANLQKQDVYYDFRPRTKWMAASTDLTFSELRAVSFS